jgi:hypothetical protein
MRLLSVLVMRRGFLLRLVKYVVVQVKKRRRTTGTWLVSLLLLLLSGHVLVVVIVVVLVMWDDRPRRPEREPSKKCRRGKRPSLYFDFQTGTNQSSVREC